MISRPASSQTGLARRAILPRRGHQWRKGRDKRPGLDALLEGMSRRGSIWWPRGRCRLGRSLPDLISLLSELATRLIPSGADPAIRSQISLLLGPSWRLINGIRRHDGIGGVDVSARHAVSLVRCKLVIVGSF